MSQNDGQRLLLAFVVGVLVVGVALVGLAIGPPVVQGFVVSMIGAVAIVARRAFAAIGVGYTVPAAQPAIGAWVAAVGWILVLVGGLRVIAALY